MKNRAATFSGISGLLELAGVGLLVAAVLIATLLDVMPLLAAAGLFALLILFGFFHPEAMLLLSVFVSVLVPVDLAVKTEGLFRVGPTRVVLAAFISGLVIRLLVYRPPLLLRRNFPLLGGVAIYMLSGIVSSSFSVERQVSAYGVIGRDLLEQFFIFYVFVWYCRDAAFRDMLKNTLFAATAAVCAFGIFEAVTHSNPLLPLFKNAAMEYREGILRVRSVFFHPIALGGFINLVLPFALIELVQRKKLRHRIALGGLLAIMLLNLLLTVSRGPWICLAVEIMIFLAWWGLRSAKAASVIVALILLAVPVMAFVYENNDTVNRLFSPVLQPEQQQVGSSEYYRITLVEAVVQRLEGQRWIYGYGPNAFDLSDVETRYGKRFQTLTSPDNHFARLLLEYGLFGACSFVFLLLLVVAVCITAVRRAPPANKLAAVGCLAGVVGFAAVNTTVSLFQMFPLGMLFWMTVAFAVNLGTTAGYDERVPRAL